MHLEWEHAKDGSVPHRPVGVGERQPNGEQSYHVARHSHRGDTIPGKTHKDHRCLYLSYDGKSHKKSEYEVLCVRD